MNAPVTVAPALSDAAALRGCLEDQVVPRLLGRRCPVVEVQVQPSSAVSSYDSYVVSAWLADERVLRLFLKDYGASRRPRRDLRARREREPRVYRELLADAGLATPHYLGTVWDDRARRHWLLLELVEGPLLRDLNLEHWISPLEWLGRLHARFSGIWDGSAPPAFLERHDERFFRRKADRALAALGSCAPPLVRRMVLVRERFGDVLPALTGGPHTLVHGAFVPANVIVVLGDRPRICPVDWEVAAVGSPFYDLAFFCDGFEAPAFDRMLAAYRRGARAGDLALPPDAEVIRAINCFRLHRVMDWLDVAIEKRYSDEAFERLVSRGEGLSALVEV